MYSSIRHLLSGLIDYAGLFPPASLDLETALGNFERYRKGEFGWMLGRFILPCTRLRELSALSKNSSLPISVLAGDDLDQDLKRIREFQLQHPGSIQAIEVKGGTVEKIRAASAKIPTELASFFEIPAGLGSAVLIAALAEDGNCAKIRTGGITLDTFPSSEDVVHFLQLCEVFGTAFKATAGLHHALRGSYPVTYEEASPVAVMHGFLNVFLATGFVRNHMAAASVREVLVEQAPEAFQFSEEGVLWRTHFLASDEILALRDQFAVSFGSCSVQEPIDHLKLMGLL